MDSAKLLSEDDSRRSYSGNLSNECHSRMQPAALLGEHNPEGLRLLPAAPRWRLLWRQLGLPYGGLGEAIAMRWWG